MEGHATLDVACRAAKSRLIFFLLLFFLPVRTLAQTGDQAAEKFSEIQKLYEAGNWDGVVRAVRQSPDEPAGLLLYRGLALAHLQRWEEAKAAFTAGSCSNRSNCAATPVASPIWSGFWRNGDVPEAPKGQLGRQLPSW